MISTAPSVQNRISRINRAIFDHRVDVGSVRDVIQRIRIENEEIGEVALLDVADVRSRFAAEKFRGISSRTLKNLHGGESGFFHQLKFTKERWPVHRADVSRVG